MRRAQHSSFEGLHCGIPERQIAAPRAAGAGSACTPPRRPVAAKMAHEQLSTTAIYADAVGREEQGIAACMWR